jgi:y4mF family transcriptional regulator
MIINSIKDLAAAVRGRRHEVRISQAQLAERAGVSRKWIYEFESGKPTAEFGLVLRVLAELDLDLVLSARSERSRDPDRAIDLDALLEEHRRA